MVVKINISMPEETLEKVDRAADADKTSRSAFLTSAAEHYLQEIEEEKARRRRQQAARAIDRVREAYGPWDGTAEVLKWRSRH